MRTALADRDTIERKRGAGGMATLYLAGPAIRPLALMAVAGIKCDK